MKDIHGCGEVMVHGSSISNKKTGQQKISRLLL